MKFGNKWRAITREGFAPISTAAVAKSSSRSASSFERTARPSPVQSMRPRITVMPMKTPMGLHVTGKAADNAIHNGSSGNERMISINRCTTLSTQPP